MVSKVLLSKGEKTTWQTPLNLWNDLNHKFKFTLDACTESDNPLATPKFYTIKEDGLSQPWFNITYCNPPYGRNNRVDLWLEKGKFEQMKGITSVFLLPSRTGTRWFHEYIYNKPDVVIEFLPRRLRFRGAKSSATFDSMIVVFKRNN